MNDLHHWRKQASAQSLGLSGGPIYARAIELLREHHCRGDFLDFGAGQGRFVTEVHDMGQMDRCLAVDLMERPAGISDDIEWLTADLNDDVPLAESEVDCITALEIVEHLENPRHMFRELFRVLRPGGVLIVSTPNNESVRAMVSFALRGHFVAFTDSSYPAHIVALNRMDLRRAAEESGFVFECFAFTDSGRIPGMTRRSWQDLSKRRLSGLRFSDNVFCVLLKR